MSQGFIIQSMTQHRWFSWFVPLVLVALLAGGLWLLWGQQQVARADALVDSDPLQSYQIYRDWMGYLPWQADLPEKAGVAALLGGEAGQALAVLQQAGQLTPSGRLTLAEAHFQLGEYDQAQAILLELYESNQKNTFLLERLATLSHWQGDFAAEQAYLEEGLSRDPAHPRLRYALALLLAANQPGLAIPELQGLQALAPDPQVESLLRAVQKADAAGGLSYQRLAAGQALASLGEWRLAELAFLNALQTNPNLGEARAWLAEAVQQLGRTEEALPLLEEAVRDSPDSAPVQALFGLYWQRQGVHGQAIDYLRTAVLLDPNNTVWRMSLAQSYEKIGDLNMALAYYQSAADLDQTNAELARALAVFCLQNDVYLNEVALPAAVRAQRLEPQNPDSLDVLARLMAALGSLEAAEKYQRDAIALNPQVAAYHYHLALVLLQQNDTLQAYDALQETVRLDPDGEFGEQARRILQRYGP